MSWVLRAFVVWPREAELLETAAQGVGMEPEDGGRPLMPFNDPVCVSEDAQDMAPLNSLQRARNRRDGLGSRKAKDVGIDFEHRTGREDHCAFQDVLELADIARPRVRHESTERGRVDSLNSLSYLCGEFLNEKLREERDVSGARAGAEAGSGKR